MPQILRPGEMFPTESHDWSGIRRPRTTCKPDIARTGSSQIQPDILRSICTAVAQIRPTSTPVSTCPLSLLDLRSTDLCSTHRPLGDHCRHSRVFPRTTQLTAPALRRRRRRASLIQPRYGRQSVEVPLGVPGDGALHSRKRLTMREKPCEVRSSARLPSCRPTQMVMERRELRREERR